MNTPLESPSSPQTRLTGPVALLFLVVTAISFLRQPSAFLSPVLAYEDGRDVFAFFYNHPEPSAVLRSYNGYLAVLPNLWGWLVLRGPVQLAPYLLAWGPLLASSFAFTFFAFPCFRPLVPRDGVRIFVALVAALAPLTNYLFLGNTMYSEWSLLVVLVLAALAPPPRNTGQALAFGAAQGLLMWSHPLSILVVPWYGLRAFAEGRIGLSTPVKRGLVRAYFSSLAGLGLAFQLLGVDREGVTAQGISELVTLTGRFFLERVVFGSLFGDAAARALRRSGHEGWIGGLAVVILVGLAAALWVNRRRFERFDRWAGVYLVWVVVGLTALYVLGRHPDLSILRSDRGFRYFWAQRVLFVLMLGMVFHRLRPARPFVRSWPVRLVAATLLVGLLVLLNRANQQAYAVRDWQGQVVRSFTADLASKERERGGRRGVRGRLERGIWTLEITR